MHRLCCALPHEPDALHLFRAAPLALAFAAEAVIWPAVWRGGAGGVVWGGELIHPTDSLMVWGLGGGDGGCLEGWEDGEEEKVWGVFTLR